MAVACPRKVTAAPRAGLGHVAWRARSPRALERRVAAIEATGLGRGWIDGDVGHGRAYRFDTPEVSAQHLFDVAELAKEAGIPIESGPARHGIGGASFLYILEPGGNRIELMGDPGYMIFDPAWKTVVWKGSEVPTAAAVWTGSPLPDSFWTYGTPQAEEKPASLETAAA